MADHSDEAHADTAWGPYRCFDVHALACLAVGQVERGRELLRQTLDMIDANMAEEASNSKAKWHLSDFALHPLLRAYKLFGQHEWPEWRRLLGTLPTFKLHFGDLTENHNLLHLAIRFLFGGLLPDTPFIDGRTGGEHRESARGEIFAWADKWVRQGSAEWGSDIYYNVNLLAWFNLFDFADDAGMKELARTMIDLFLLDEAMDLFAGVFAGAARRGYGCYRTDPFQSPSRPLWYLYLGEPAGGRPFNLHFVGGVLQAALSSYRLPAAIVKIARWQQPIETKTTHTVWPLEGDHVSKHTYRDRHVMLSVMNTPPGGGSNNEHVFQATLSERAFIFATHPTATKEDGRPGRLSVAEALATFERPAPDPRTPAWTYANMPPSGRPEDVRPGWWQCNRHLPRSFGAGRMGMQIYNVPADDPHPFVHLWFPRKAFDEFAERTDWHFGRVGEGYVGVWTSSPLTWVTKGLWADIEARTASGRVAIVTCVGSGATHESFEAFVRSCLDILIQWDEANLKLMAAKTVLDYAAGPSDGVAPIDTRYQRIETPWGSMRLGDTRLSLNVAGERHEIGH